MHFWHSVKDNWPQIVKYLSTVFAAYYGLYATLNDFHRTRHGQKTHQLPPKGYVGITLLGVATALSLFADVNKDRQDRIKSDADNARIQGITTNLVDELGKTDGIRTQIETQLKGTETLKTVLDSSLAGQKESSRTLSNISSGLGRTLVDQENSARTLTGISTGLNLTLDSEHKLAQEQKQLQLQSIRSFYPLEPITILYQVEYLMDQPAFAAYLKRITSGSSPSDLSIGDPTRIPADEVVRLENGQMPGNAMGEEVAKNALVDAGMMFDFTDGTSSSEDPNISYDSIPDSETRNLHDDLATHPESKWPTKRSMQLWADFHKHVFVELVTCENPLRFGRDLLAFSRVDLAGQTLSWKFSQFHRAGESIDPNFPREPDVHFSLLNIEFRFSGDPVNSNPRPIMEAGPNAAFFVQNFPRVILIPNGAQNHIISPRDVGLTKIFKDLEISQ